MCFLFYSPLFSNDGSALFNVFFRGHVYGSQTLSTRRADKMFTIPFVSAETAFFHLQDPSPISMTFPSR